VRWKAVVRESLEALPRPHSQFAVETLAWTFARSTTSSATSGSPYASTSAHLLLRGDDVPSIFDLFSERIAMIHLHGVQAGKDHIALDRLGAAERAMIARTVARRDTREASHWNLFAGGFHELARRHGTDVRRGGG